MSEDINVGDFVRGKRVPVSTNSLSRHEYDITVKRRRWFRSSTCYLSFYTIAKVTKIYEDGYIQVKIVLQDIYSIKNGNLVGKHFDINPEDLEKCYIGE